MNVLLILAQSCEKQTTYEGFSINCLVCGQKLIPPLKLGENSKMNIFA